MKAGPMHGTTLEKFEAPVGQAASVSTARCVRSTAWRFGLLFGILASLPITAEVSAARGQNGRLGAEDRARIRLREGEVIVTFGNGIGGKGIGDKSDLRAKLVEEAISDSVLAEDAITLAGGEVRFRYRTAVIGFSAVLPARDPFQPLVLPFKSGAPNIRRNWEISYPKRRATRPRMSFAAAGRAPPNGLDRIGQRLLNLNGQFIPTFVDRQVHAYVIDSGILETHPEFNTSGPHPISNVLEGYDEFGDVPTSACLRHGSLVAGVIGAANYGVAPGIKLHSVRVMDCNKGVDLARAIKGIDWVTEHFLASGKEFAAVANMSFVFPRRHPKPGWESDLAEFERVVRTSISTGITYVAAAGNYKKSSCDYSPAWMEGVITVASVDPKDDHKAADSNVGTCTDLFAPGVNILSVGTEYGHPWDYDSGTSLAAPHVTGVAAIILWRDLGLRPEQVRTRILAAANDKNSQDTYAQVWCGVEGRRDSPNILLHWGAGSDDGKEDAEPPPRVPRECR